MSGVGCSFVWRFEEVIGIGRLVCIFFDVFVLVLVQALAFGFVGVGFSSLMFEVAKTPAS